MKQLKGEIVQVLPDVLTPGAMYFVPTDNGRFTINISDDNGDVRPLSELNIQDATGDLSFTKQVVAKADGTLGLVDKVSSDGSSGVTKLKDDSAYELTNTTSKTIRHVVGPDINIKGGRWVDVKMTFKVLSEVANRRLRFLLIPKTKPYDINKSSMFRVGSDVMNGFVNTNLKQVTVSQQEMTDNTASSASSGIPISNINHNVITIFGSVYLNDDNVVNLVLFQEQNATPYKMFVENIKIEIE